MARLKKSCRIVGAHICALAAALLVNSGPLHAETAYWIRPTNNFVLDKQTVALIAAHSRLVIIRAQVVSANGPGYRDLVSSFHEAAPELKVLMYSLATVAPIKGSIDDLVASGLDNPSVLVRSPSGAPMAGLPDPGNAAYQDGYVRRLTSVAHEMGVDGVALDESFRTPKIYPKRLATICEQDPSFCAQYADGVDRLYARVKAAIAPKLFLFNGIWNDYPGEPEDQAQLLRSADAAQIEMFGGDPTQPQRSFSNDVLPYLKIVSAHPDKRFLFFGRTSSMQYVSYADDYLRQRYLYCAYLLVARQGTYFKYLANFEAPAMAGLRTGGTDTYADWFLNVGTPLGPYSQSDGVYRREFQNAVVYVAPDDSASANVTPSGTLYTPEGEAVSGPQTLRPGTGLLLFRSPPPAEQDAVWAAASIPGITSMGVLEGSSPEYVSVPAPKMPPADILLDAIRTLHPRAHLDISFRLDDPHAKILAIAEVDDDNGNGHSPYAIVEIAHGDPRRGQIYAPSAQYRIPQGDAPGGWRLIPVEVGAAGQWQHMSIGPEVFSGPEGAKLHFRRWAYLRLDGPLSFASAHLTP